MSRDDEELAAGLRGSRGEGHAVGRSQLPLHQVLGRLADENALAMTGRQGVAAMDVHAARRGEGPGVRCTHQAGNERGGRGVAADRPDGCLRARGRHLLGRLGKRQVRIALEIARLQDRVHHRTAIGTGEPAAVVVYGQAELALAAGQLERQRGRVEARIARAERHGRTIGRSGTVTVPPASPLVRYTQLSIPSVG